jgi:hypothetical protein
MKDNVGGMESQMDLLLSTVTSVRSKSDGVNANLSARRERIESLNGTRSLLRKVQVQIEGALQSILRFGSLIAAYETQSRSQPV